MPSLSLQTRWVSAQADNQVASTAIAVGPRGFKSALQSLINFLIKHEVRANIWLKLPKDDAWWTDVLRYGQQAAGCTIYALSKQDGGPLSLPIENSAASFRSITIEQDNELKREYLCLVVADNFASALLAARSPAGSAPDKRNLSLYSTTSGTTVSAIASGLKQVVEYSIETQQASQQLAQSDDETLDSTVSDALLANHAMLSQWSRYFPEALSERNHWPLSEAYLSWQLEFQESLRAQAAACRSAEKSTQGDAFQSLSSDFLAQAGQELQAPLTTIKTALTLLGSPALKLTQRQRYLEMIAAQCDRQKSLIDSVIQLLQLQTTESKAAQPIQLADLIPGIVSTYQPIAEERGIMLAYTVPPNLATVSGVESDLKEVLIHLINNSIQVTPKNGRVWVAATPYDAHFIALTVKDSGAGMPRSETYKLFEAFYRQPVTNTANAQNSSLGYAGVGLGLTLTQHLVKRIGGTISAESEPDKGTTLQVLLPIHRLAHPHSRPHHSRTALASTSESRTGSFTDSLVGAPAQ